MTNDTSNACVLAPTDAPWGPFILPILLTAPWVVFIGIIALINVGNGNLPVNDLRMVSTISYAAAGVGLWFRQEWALWLLAMITGVGVAQISYFLVHPRWNLEECGLIVLFSALLVASACYQALTCLAAVVGAMVCIRTRRKNILK